MCVRWERALTGARPCSEMDEEIVFVTERLSANCVETASTRPGAEVSFQPKVTSGGSVRLAASQDVRALLFSGLALVLAVVAPGCCSCPETGWAPKTPEAVDAGVPVLGDADCPIGASDCNICANDVVAQFESGSWQTRRERWSFDAPAFYDAEPHQAYSSVGGHVQGFVRLNGDSEAYAVVHSQERLKLASLSFVERHGGALSLEGLYRLEKAEGHTSGLFAIGRYVGLIDRPGQLLLVDTRAGLPQPPVSMQRVFLSNTDPKEGFVAAPRAHGLSDWSGGVAIAKLKAGSYLLIANQGGGSAGNSHFFELGPFLGSSAEVHLSVREVGESFLPSIPVACADQAHSENVTFVTECKTGHLYAVHVGSNDRVHFGKALKAVEPGAFQTFWRVSRVIELDGRIGLEPVGVYLERSHLGYCHGRSAGSVFVDPVTHGINLLCHERAQGDPWHGAWHFQSTMATKVPVVGGAVSATLP